MKHALEDDLTLDVAAETGKKTNRAPKWCHSSVSGLPTPAVPDAVASAIAVG